MNALTADDWRRLRALRDRFLTDASEDYWTPRDLALYDAVFAPRIGWKWEGALASLTRAGWTPRSTRILDWGCGTGIAARAVGAWSGIRDAAFFDQSPAATTFSRERWRANGGIDETTPSRHHVAPGTLLLLSHVAGELSSAEFDRLATLAATADEVIWVEPGSRDISRRLIGAHAILRQAGHHPIAPCTHAQPCPMGDAANERHWCHFFARPPGEIFQSPFWRDVSLQLGIDLRALPYTFLTTSRHAPVAWPAGAERLIGHPRELKAHGKLLCCGADGLAERTLQRRDDPELFRQVVKKGADGVFVWNPNAEKPGAIRGGRIVDAPGSGT